VISGPFETGPNGAYVGGRTKGGTDMDRLSFVLTLATGPVLTGGLVIVVLSLGYYGWGPVVAAAATGIVLSWPAAYLVSRWIKRRDPDFDHTRADHGPLPDPNAPEV